MNKEFFRAARPLVLVFVVITALVVGGRAWFLEQGIDPRVTLAGNIIIWTATILSLFILLRGGRSANPQSFVRSMYGSFLIRFFLVLAAAFAYIMIQKKEVNKPALILCAGLYILYAGLEIAAMMRYLKLKKNA
jgi:hypothetical protein